ncbi:MAG: hypothetical protein KBF98_08135 [Rhodoferax sp.]|nr:hypothetical protein [Rhodoferax sp.]
MDALSDKFQYAIDDAPGKELIAEYLKTGDLMVLDRFFQVRFEWCGGYPLVHDRFVTYGAFDDFLSSVEPENRYPLIPMMVRMAETVPDSHFHCALFLLVQMIPDSKTGERPDGFSDAFLRLRIRAEKLSFLPNLECAWDSLALKQRYLISDNDPLRKYTARQLGLTRRWTEFFPSPLLNFKKLGMTECQADMPRLRKKIQNLGCLPGQRKLIYITKIEEASYWVWRLPGRTGTAHLYRIVFLRQPPQGNLGLGHWDIYKQFTERDTPTQISDRLMKIEFSQLNLEPVDRVFSS